jgi:superfamily II DNA or RNA helicase
MTGLTPPDLAHSAIVFEPADPPRAGNIAGWPWESDAELTVAVISDGHVELREVAAVRLPMTAAISALLDLPADAHPAAAFWGAATRLALRLVGAGRLLPGVSAAGFDAWRVGPLGSMYVEAVRQLAAAMPAQARAVPIPGSSPIALPDAESLLRAYLDAVADTLPRTPAAALAAGHRAFAATAPLLVPELHEWSDEVAAGIDAGVRVSLRLEADDLAGGPFRAVVQVHSVADPTLVVDAAALWDGADLGPRAAVEATLAVRRAARHWAPLERLLQVAVPDEITLGDEDVGELAGGAGARLAAAGVDVHWPRELVRELTARTIIGPSESAPSDVGSFLGGDELLTFRWQVAVGDQPLTAAELDQLAEAQRPVVRLRDRWMLVGPDLIRKARERELKPLTALDALGVALSGATQVDGEAVEVVTTGWLEELRRRIADPDSGAEPIGQPAGLTATLRDYQLRGLRWLDRMTSLGLGGCLADDMGLGKTITLIALHLHRQSGPTLVVCPASLLGNWEREIGRFAPGTPVHRFHGTERALQANGFVLTTYGTMRRDIAALAGHRWGMVVADEAQHIKNPVSQTAKALRQIRGEARIALTGTPVENNLSELWAILDWTTPGLLGTLSAFRSRWAAGIEAGDNPVAAQRFGRLVKPFLLRRRKSDPGIAPELPAKTETDRPVSLTREQASLYEAVVREAMAEIKASSAIARRGLILKLLTGLKQICNHPAQYLHEESPVLAGRSGKLELLDELLDTIAAEDGAVLVFTQYVAMAKLLEKHLAARGVPTQLLHGGTPVRKRDELVRRFQAGGVPVFLLSLKAAGTGLNLTRADHVVHFDRWWNPAVEEQATDRAYRIGQTKPVQVHRLIAEGTVEDRISALLQSKRDLADAVLTSGETALTELSDSELASLVELRGTR